MLHENKVMPEPLASTVYIADSDSEVGKSIQFLLGTDNIEAIVFADGQGLLDHAITNPPSCVVSEAVLPDITGVTLLKRLRQAGVQRL
jgi:FixJ family two-component response regulator